MTCSSGWRVMLNDQLVALCSRMSVFAAAHESYGT